MQAFIYSLFKILVFALMVWARYDVSGVWPDKIQQILERGWMHLADQYPFDSPIVRPFPYSQPCSLYSCFLQEPDLSGSRWRINGIRRNGSCFVVTDVPCTSFWGAHNHDPM